MVWVRGRVSLSIFIAYYILADHVKQALKHDLSTLNLNPLTVDYILVDALDAPVMFPVRQRGQPTINLWV